MKAMPNDHHPGHRTSRWPSPAQSQTTDNTQPFVWPVRVYWEDTDAGGVVYYANYLKFFERARTEWLRARGVHQRALRESTGHVFVVSEANVRYLKGARLDEELWVTTALVKSGHASLTLRQQAWRRTTEPATLLCEATIRVGWIDPDTGKPDRIPASIIETLR